MTTEPSWVLFRSVIERIGPMPQKYFEPFRARAVRMGLDRLEHDDAPSRYVVIKETAPRLNIAVETLRRWVEQAEIDAGKCPGVSSDAQAEIRRLKRENSPTVAANEILKSASA